jgi:chloride channel 3/4/5
VSAILAFLIVRAEMALFDLKEGFCATSWGTAKRFCCTSPHHGGNDAEECRSWVEWGEFFASEGDGRKQESWIRGGPEFSAYIVIAVSSIVYN